ncbi:MAG TPA: hypothetical protein DCE42_13940 [Myxococcales bacterium]|nr:hypothetical protein [Deltaproteobacteria bacterium]MBU50962.1 hypothetical protein [Deltaproteobacteria bacterium]HAA55859.1 hypothetical protein [Myxococcales bacterium]|tara:strand:- start:12846 stop:14123 length:1278 start_codon:yes stop_codon:yes gene_type:complete
MNRHITLMIGMLFVVVFVASVEAKTPATKIPHLYQMSHTPSGVRKILRELIKRTMTRHPALKRARLRLEGLKKTASVSGAWPNINLTYQREQLFPPVGQDTLGGQVTIPLGGSPFRQKDVAKTFARLQKSYISLLSFRLQYIFLRTYGRLAQRRQQVQLAQHLLHALKRLRPILQARERGGKVAGIEFMRFRMAVEQQTQSIKRLQEQTQRLAWKIGRWTGLSAQQVLARVKHHSPASLQLRHRKAKQHPQLAYLSAQKTLYKAQLRLAQAKGWPKLSFSLAYLRQQAETANQPDGHGFVVGMSLPLPIFQRNQRGTQNARNQLQQSRLLFRQTQRQLKQRQLRTKKQYQQILVRQKRYQKKVIHRLPALLKAAQAAFEGGTSLTEFLTTYRSIIQYQQFGLRLQYTALSRALLLEEAYGNTYTR